MYRVIILRHAKAEQFAETDHARPLSNRGHQQAKECSEWLKTLPFTIDHALVSSSKRTTETWEDLKINSTVTISDDAYNASAEDLVHLIRHTNNGSLNLLVVAHNPGVSDLAFANGFAGELSTCSAVVIECEGELVQFGLIESKPAETFRPAN